MANGQDGQQREGFHTLVIAITDALHSDPPPYAALRQAVADYVRSLRLQGTPPEQALVALKELLADAHAGKAAGQHQAAMHCFLDEYFGPA